MPNGGTNFGDGQTVDHFLTNPAGNWIFVRSSTANIPQGVAGYAIGCLLAVTDGTGNLLHNRGTATVSNFAGF